MPGVLKIYTIYHGVSDQREDAWVVRRSLIECGAILPDDSPLAVCDTLEEARCAIPGRLALIPRSPEDDPVIVESWL